MMSRSSTILYNIKLSIETYQPIKLSIYLEFCYLNQRQKQEILKIHKLILNFLAPIAKLSWKCTLDRSSRPELFCKKSALKISQNSQENICASVSILIKLQAFLYRTPSVAASFWKEKY